MERHAVFTAIGFRFECMLFELHMHSIRILEDADKIREAPNNSVFVVILRCIGRGICAGAQFRQTPVRSIAIAVHRDRCPSTNPRLSDRLELDEQENKYLSAGPFDLLAAVKRNADPLWFELPLPP